MVRRGEPDDTPTDGDRGKMQLWNNPDDSKVGLQIGPMKVEFTPDEARDHADELEAHVEGTQYEDDEETQQFISDLRERADMVEDADGDD